MQFRFGISTLFVLTLVVAVMVWLTRHEVVVEESHIALTVARQTTGIRQLKPKRVVRRRIHPTLLVVGMGTCIALLLLRFHHARNRIRTKPR